MKDWQNIELEKLASVERGKFSARPRNDPKYYGGKYPFVQTSDVSCSNGRLSDYKQTLNEEGLKVSKVFPKGTLLITIAANIGDVAITEIEMACPDSLVGIVPQKGVDSYWLLHSLKMKKRKLEADATQNAQKNINLQVLRPLVLKVPPAKEQEAIGEIFRKWDSAIDLTVRLIAAKKEIRNGLMQQLLTGKRRFPGFTEPWRKVRIGEVLKQVKRSVKWDDGEQYHLISVRRRSGGLFLRGVLFGHEIKTQNLHTVQKDDFLISKMQVVHGACGLVKEEFQGMKVSGSYIILRTKNSMALDIRFFDWLSKTPEMYHNAYISSYGVHIEKMTFYFSDYLKREIEISPTLKEQKKIVDALETITEEIDLLNLQKNLFAEQKKGLMQQLLTGKIRVRIPETVANL